MKTRLSTVAATLSIAALLGWLAYSVPDEAPLPSSPPQVAAPGPQMYERMGGSEVSCAVPLAWRIARVDPEFDMTEAVATALVEEGAELWQEGTGRRLFIHDPQGGFPIRLIYDDRQERVDSRTERERSIEDLTARLERERDVLASRGERLDQATTAHMARAADLERRVSEHNATIREWNRRDDLTQALLRRLEAYGDSLQVEQERMAAERRKLQADQELLRRAEEELIGRFAERQRLVDEVAESFPPAEVEAGEYREAVTRVEGSVVSVSREIRLYRFEREADLRLVAAHELGHALGLGHSGDPTGVMSANARSDRPVTSLADSDVALLQAVCPAPDADR